MQIAAVLGRRAVLQDLAMNHPVRFIGRDEIREIGSELTPAELHQAVDRAWCDIRAGIAFGGKAVLSLPEDDFWRRPERMPFKPAFSAERLGWKLSSLYSVNAEFGAVKVIGANAFNRKHGLPRSTSTIVLLDKLTMRPLAILDGTAISASRTGTYASTVFDRCFGPDQSVSVFLFGAGPIAQSVIACLDHLAADRVEQIFVKSRGRDGARAMTALLQPHTSIRLIPVEDNRRLCECAFVVTATNARAPIFEDSELMRDAVTLHLGGDEIPQAYLLRALRSGTVVCDNLAMVSQRGSQSVALYFQRKGLTLEAVGALLGVRELSSLADWSDPLERPVCITCVGLPMLDLYTAQATYEKHLRLSAPLRAD